MYPYVKYSDGTEVVFSNIYEGKNGEKCIDVHFERPTKNGFDSVRRKLPSYEVVIWEGNCILESNKSRIPKNELNTLMEIISKHYLVIVSRWMEYYNIKNVDDIKYYC